MLADITPRQLLLLRASKLADIEREAIFSAIDEVGGNMRLAAQHLGISRSTLYRKLEVYQKRAARHAAEKLPE